MTNKNNRGFTFIELAVAVLILGILSIAVVPPFFRYIAKAKENTTKANIQSLRTALEEYKADVGYYPRTLNALIKNIENEKKWDGPYLGGAGSTAEKLQKLKEIPKDGWNNDFVYKRDSKAKNEYELYSWGPNGPGSPQDEWIED